MQRRAFMLLTALCFCFGICPVQASDLQLVAKFGGDIQSSAIEGRYAVLAQGSAIRILDIHDKEKIHQVGVYYNNYGRIEKLRLCWPALYYYSVSSRGVWRNLLTLDVSDPSNPHENESMDISESRKGDFAWGVNGSLLVVNPIDEQTTIGEYTRIYDISNPSKPKAIVDLDETKIPKYLSVLTSHSPSTIPRIPKEVVYPERILDVLVDGNMAYILDGDRQCSVIDVSQPQTPKYLGLVKDPTNIIEKMHKKEKDRQTGSTSFDHYKLCLMITDDESESTHTLPLTADNASAHSIVKIVLVKDDVNTKTVRVVEELMELPSLKDSYDRSWITDKILCIFTKDSNTGGTCEYVTIYDLQNPLKPHCLGSYGEMEDVPYGIAVSGDMVYIADGANGLIVLRSTNQGEKK